MPHHIDWNYIQITKFENCKIGNWVSFIGTLELAPTNTLLKMKLFLAIFDEFQSQPHNTPTWFVLKPSYLLPSLSFHFFVFLSSYHHQHFFFSPLFLSLLPPPWSFKFKEKEHVEKEPHGDLWRREVPCNSKQNEASQFFQIFCLPFLYLPPPLSFLSLFSFFNFFTVTLFIVSFFWILVCFYCYQIVQWNSMARLHNQTCNIHMWITKYAMFIWIDCVIPYTFPFMYLDDIYWI